MAHDLPLPSERDPALETLDRLNPNRSSTAPSPALGRIGHPGNGAFLEELHESWKISPPDHKSADIDLLRKEIDSLTPRILRAWIHLLEVESSEITLTN